MANNVTGTSSNQNSPYSRAFVNQKDPNFDAVWEVIKSWDINVLDAYTGYMGANGNHVQLILDAINKNLRQQAYNRAMKGIGP